MEFGPLGFSLIWFQRYKESSMNGLIAEHAGISSLIPAEKSVARAEGFDWQQIGQELDDRGSALLQGILSSDECVALAGLYSEDALFRSRIVMARHGFGRGEYKYFNYPLPDLIQALRQMFYLQLAPVANR